jgi:hypothetical protein
MLTLKVINENPGEVISRLKKKNFDAKEIVEKIIELDAIRRNSQTSLDGVLSEINSISKSIGSLIKEGKKDEATSAREKVATLKESSKELEATLKDAQDKIEELLVTIPNLPHELVPEGKSAEDNPVTENRVVHTLEGIEVINKGIPDKTNSFMVEFRSRTIEPFVYLREDGLIAAINAEPEDETVPKLIIPASETASENPRRYFSQETLMAGSTAKQAELVARQIFDLRRNRNDILSGEAVNMPPDGNAYNVVMQEINRQEKALLILLSEPT